MTVRTIKKKSIDLSLRQLTENIQKKLDELVSQRHHFSFGNRTTQVQPIDVVRWASEMTSVSSESKHLKNIILSALNDAEGTQGTSAVVCLIALSHLLRRPGSLWSNKNSESIENELKVLLKRHTRRCSSSEVLQILSNFDRDPNSLE